MSPSPNTNPVAASLQMHGIIDTFWCEFKAFENGTHPYHKPSRWASLDVTRGNSYLWHGNYSIPYTSVCRVTSKLCGIGPAERSWGRVKQVKDGKRSHFSLSGESTEKRSILFVSSKKLQAQIHCECMEQLSVTNFDLQLDKFCVETWALKEAEVERVFWSWVEDWEEEARKKNDCVAKTQ